MIAAQHDYAVADVPNIANSSSVLAEEVYVVAVLPLATPSCYPSTSITLLRCSHQKPSNLLLPMQYEVAWARDQGVARPASEKRSHNARLTSARRVTNDATDWKWHTVRLTKHAARDTDGPHGDNVAAASSSLLYCSHQARDLR